MEQISHRFGLILLWPTYVKLTHKARFLFSVNMKFESAVISERKQEIWANHILHSKYAKEKNI